MRRTSKQTSPAAPSATSSRQPGTKPPAPIDRDIGLEILEGLRQLKRGEHGRVMQVARKGVRRASVSGATKRRCIVLLLCASGGAVVSGGAAAPDAARAAARTSCSLVAPPAAPGLRWTLQVSGVTSRLRGVSAVNETVAWASGADGTILRTVDAGRTWTTMRIPETEKLDFRDVDAFSADEAYALSIGPGDASRIYKTTDGGRRWVAQHINRDPKAFFDAMTFWTADRGVAVSDSVDGQFVILLTHDGGRTWTRAPASGLPPALPNEGAFAASGSNIAVAGTSHVWIGTGAASSARVLRSSDGGRTWTVANTPLPAGPSAGIFSVAFRDTQHGVIVGGDYKTEGEAIDNVAITNDGGATWTLATKPVTGDPKPQAGGGLSGFRSAVAFLPPLVTASPASRQPRPQQAVGRLVAVGPSGADYSADDGRTWQSVEGPGAGFHAFSVARNGRAAWAVGEQGRIARLDGDSPPSSSPAR